MMAGIGDLVANLGVNTAPWTKGLNSARGQFSSFTGGISSNVGRMVSTLAPLGAAIGAAFGAKASIDAYSESLANARKLESVLQSTGGAAGFTSQQIADYAAELQAMTNFEDDATVGAAAMLASFTNVRGDVFKSALAGAQDLTAIMGGDLEGNVKLLGKALNDPAEGLAKLSRAGIQFTEEQTAQIVALQKSGNILGAQTIILDQLERKFGGAAAATADPLKQLANTIGDVAENIGSALLPAVSVGADALRNMLGTVVGGGDSFKSFGIEAAVQLSHISDTAQLTGLNLGIAFLEWIPGSEKAMEQFFAHIDASLSGITAGFKTASQEIVDTFNGISTAGEKAWNKIKDGFGGGLIKGLIGGGAAQGGLGGSSKDLLSGLVGGAFPATDALAATKTATSFTDAYTEQFNKTMQGFAEEGGLTNSLKTKQAKLAEDLKTSMEEQRDKLTAQFSPLKTVPGAGASTGLEEFGKGEAEKAAKATNEAKALILKAALQGSSEAAATFTRGVGTGPQPERLGPKLDTLIAVTKSNKPEDPPDVAGVI